MTDRCRSRRVTLSSNPQCPVELSHRHRADTRGPLIPIVRACTLSASPCRGARHRELGDHLLDNRPILFHVVAQRRSSGARLGTSRRHDLARNGEHVPGRTALAASGRRRRRRSDRPRFEPEVTRNFMIGGVPAAATTPPKGLARAAAALGGRVGGRIRRRTRFSRASTPLGPTERSCRPSSNQIASFIAATD